MTLLRILATIFLAGLFLAPTDAEAQTQRRRTTRKNLKAVQTVKPHKEAAPDTILLDSISDQNGSLQIRLSGYDKPLRSYRESIFATNHTPYDVDGIVLKLAYFDSSGREIHQRTVTVRCDIPRGETRKIDFRSWDSQQSFYYKLSPKPRRDGATPYDVKCHATAIIIPSTSIRNNPD